MILDLDIRVVVLIDLQQVDIGVEWTRWGLLQNNVCSTISAHGNRVMVNPPAMFIKTRVILI